MFHLVISGGELIIKGRKLSLADLNVLDCMDSGKLSDLESLAFRLSKIVLFSKVALCLVLATIKSKELYKQIGIASFKEYLKTQRITLHYNTAHEYAKIGQVFINHKEELEKIDEERRRLNLTNISHPKKTELLIRHNAWLKQKHDLIHFDTDKEEDK